MRTLPCTWAPLAAMMVTPVPGLMRATSVLVTSARHSRRPWRIIRNSSVPAPTTEPTVAVRAEITPLSGAVSCEFFSRTCTTDTFARAASTRARAVDSAVVYWAICWALNAPVSFRLSARDALAAASASVACASATAACTCSSSARAVSELKVARTWPFFTISPTVTRTSVSFKPFTSAPMMASCQGAILPLAFTCKPSALLCGCTAVTVNAALGAPFDLGGSAASE